MRIAVDVNGVPRTAEVEPRTLLADFLRDRADADDAEIREALAGNLCRCTGYEKILDAVRLAAQRMSTGAQQ